MLRVFEIIPTPSIQEEYHTIRYTLLSKQDIVLRHIGDSIYTGTQLKVYIADDPLQNNNTGWGNLLFDEEIAHYTTEALTYVSSMI